MERCVAVVTMTSPFSMLYALEKCLVECIRFFNFAHHRAEFLTRIVHKVKKRRLFFKNIFVRFTTNSLAAEQISFLLFSSNKKENLFAFQMFSYLNLK